MSTDTDTLVADAAASGIDTVERLERFADATPTLDDFDHFGYETDGDEYVDLLDILEYAVLEVTTQTSESWGNDSKDIESVTLVFGIGGPHIEARYTWNGTIRRIGVEGPSRSGRGCANDSGATSRRCRGAGGWSMTTYRHESPFWPGYGIWSINDGEDVWIQPDKNIKSRNVDQFDLPPGWYREQSIDKALRTVCPTCHHKADGKVNDYFAITPAGEYEPVPSTALSMLAVMISGPLPGEPGTWNGTRCKCGDRRHGIHHGHDALL